MRTESLQWNDVQDEWAPREQIPYTPQILKDALYQTPEWKAYADRLRKDAHIPGTKITISQIPTAYKWLLSRLGFEIQPDSLKDKTAIEYRKRYTVANQAMSEAETLFFLLVEDKHEEALVQMLPCLSDRQIATYQRVTEKISLPVRHNKKHIIKQLINAWERFHKDPDLVEQITNPPLFKEFDFPDPEEELRLRQSDFVYNLGIGLAHHWGEYAYQKYRYPEEVADNSHLLGEYRNILVILNLTCGLQIPSNFDGVTLLQQKDRVSAFMTKINLVMPHHPSDWVQKNSAQLQIELLLLTAQKFTFHFLNEQGVTGIRNAYPTKKLNHWESEGMGQARLIHRMYDPQNGTIQVKKIDQSLDFKERLEWLGQAINTFKVELKEYLRTGIIRKHHDRMNYLEYV